MLYRESGVFLLSGAGFVVTRRLFFLVVSSPAVVRGLPSMERGSIILEGFSLSLFREQKKENHKINKFASAWTK